MAFNTLTPALEFCRNIAVSGFIRFRRSVSCEGCVLIFNTVCVVCVVPDCSVCDYRHAGVFHCCVCVTRSDVTSASYRSLLPMMPLCIIIQCEGLQDERSAEVNLVPEELDCQHHREHRFNPQKHKHDDITWIQRCRHIPQIFTPEPKLERQTIFFIKMVIVCTVDVFEKTLNHTVKGFVGNPVVLNL